MNFTHTLTLDKKFNTSIHAMFIDLEILKRNQNQKLECQYF